VTASRASSGNSARPLVVTADGALLDDLLRLVATAGAEAEVATGGPALRRAAREAPLVLLDAEALTVPAVRALPRRPGVVVVSAAAMAPERWAAAVEVGAERVAVLPGDERWLLGRLAAAVRRPVERGRLVAVSGSAGGAGASTLAAAVALAAAPGALLVDADPWGGGVDLLLGAERADGLRWPDLVGLRGRVAGDALLAALPERDGVHVLAADRRAAGEVPPEALVAVGEAGVAEGCTVVLDVPRPAPPATRTAVAGADLRVLVVPARLRATGGARLLVTDEESPWSGASLVVRTVPGGLSVPEVEDAVGRPVVAVLGHDRGAGARGERGDPPSVTARTPLGIAARRVLGALARVQRAA
jgi:secretion/DNA translocation related CpaE-like protein